jgi:hypothetical protein
MTEPKNYRDPIPATARREIYSETVADPVDAAVEDSRDIYEQRISGPAGEEVVRSEHVSIPSTAARHNAAVVRAKQVSYFVFGFIEVLLATRFVLLLLGANQASAFVRLLYNLSRPFVLPFQGIFGEPAFGDSVIAWSALVGIIVYALVAYGVARLIELIYAPARQPQGR